MQRVPDGGLLLHEVYASVQGESSYVGLPCTFVRTTACNLRCTYCDTPHAFAQGKPWRLVDVEAAIARLAPRLVLVTGGEPLLQPNVLPLMTRLCDRGYTVLLETSGSLDIRPVDPRVVRIVDMKTPSSGEVAANRYDNLAALRPRDELKFVLGGRDDYLWARTLVRERRLHEACTVLFGPVFGALEPRELVDWILADALPVRLQVQVHKYIWDPEVRGV
ncbi:MAG TPA: radical SAM protein [Myxococcota bacterium]|nr:radical SAM protein [Myxococcota bacterium]